MFSLMQYRKTYRAGLLQAKAYRILKSETARVLKPYSLTTVEWTVLGLLHDTKKGCTVKQLAEEIGVRMPFMTNIINDLVTKKLLERTEGSEDRRTKHITLTKKGVQLVKILEPKLKKAMRQIFKGISITAGGTYISVLDTIVQNSTTMNISSDFEGFQP